MQRRRLVVLGVALLTASSCAPGSIQTGDEVAKSRSHLEDLTALRSRLKERFGVVPRRYTGLFDGSNEAERLFLRELPKVTRFTNENIAANGGDFTVLPSELATNFITEGGFTLLDENKTFDIDGFGRLGIDTIVDNYAALKPWLHESVRLCVELGYQTREAYNEKGQTVHSLTGLLLEEGFYANAGMYTWAKMVAARDLKAKGVAMKDLEPAGQIFWATIYFNAGPGRGKSLLGTKGANWYQTKWTAADDAKRHFLNAQFNALWRTATGEYLRQALSFASEVPPAAGFAVLAAWGDPGIQRRAQSLGPECGEVDYYGTCEGTTLKYCADEQLVTVACGGPCDWGGSDLGYDCVPDTNASCNGVTYQGSCRGSVLTYCRADGAALVRFDCSTTGATCGWLGDELGAGCVPPPPASDCGDVDWLGRCEEGVLVYCGDDGRATLECAGRGYTCGWQDDTYGNMCLEPAGCGDLDYFGRCDGDTLRYCDAGAAAVIECGAYGLTCGWQSPDVGYDCLDGAAPEPSSCTLDYYGRCDGGTLWYCDGTADVSIECGAAGMSCAWEGDTIGYNCVTPPTCALGAAGECRGGVLASCHGAEVVEVDCAAYRMTCGWSDAAQSYACLPIPAAGCAADQYTCADQSCVPATWRCDGYLDCPGGDDEAGCAAAGCVADQYACGDGACIPGSFVCDRVADCSAGEDEQGCEPVGCTSEQFTCVSGACVPAGYRCDGYNDCADGDDEVGCLGSSCADDQFTCADGSCIAAIWRCDTYPDCVGGDDEAGCVVAVPRR